MNQCDIVTCFGKIRIEYHIEIFVLEKFNQNLKSFLFCFTTIGLCTNKFLP